MTRYHLSADGAPRTCDAQPGNCPLGSESPHLEASTPEEARRWAEKKNAERYGELAAPAAASRAPWHKRMRLKKERDILLGYNRELSESLDRSTQRVAKTRVRIAGITADIESLIEERMELEYDERERAEELDRRIAEAEGSREYAVADLDSYLDFIAPDQRKFVERQAKISELTDRIGDR